MSNSHFPNFAECLAQALKASAKRQGLLAYLPWFLLACVGVSIGSSYLLAYLYWPQIEISDTIATLAAVIVVGGLLIAVSVACMTQIYVTVSDPLFGDYLKTEEVFDQFLFWPQFTLLIQIVYVLGTSFGLIACLAVDDNFVRLTTLTMSIYLLAYTTTKTWQLIEALRLLGWHRQEYASLLLREAQNRNRQEGR